MQELPKYHETFTPILKVLKDGKSVHYNELRKIVRDTFYSDLPDGLLKQSTKDGDQLILNRIGWGKVYLKQAGMIEQPARAMVQITDKGCAALEHELLTLEDIKKDTDFLAHRARTKQRQATQPDELADEQSPQDMIDQGVGSIEDEVKADLLERVRASDPFYFEQVVCDLFEKMGYGGAKATVKTGDGGIDGIINQDELGLEKIYIQAKRYNGHNVRELEIRNFIGAMSGDTRKGIFVTTSAFDSKAIQKAKEAHHAIILIDGEQLMDLMYKFGIGVQPANTYVVKEIDEDYYV